MLAPIPVSYSFLQQSCSKARGVSLWALVGDRTAFDHVIDRLRDVRRVIADALNILRTEHEMHAERDVTRVFHHVGQKLTKQRGTNRVDFLVAVPHRERSRDVVDHKRMENLRKQ